MWDRKTYKRCRMNVEQRTGGIKKETQRSERRLKEEKIELEIKNIVFFTH